jgi:hypothetical protein
MNAKIHLRFAHWIIRTLGDNWGGNNAPPGVEQRLDLLWKDGKQKFYATTYNNDGFELWMGTPCGWWGFLSAPEAHKLAKFILWDWWMVGTWCGLKRWIWYKSLHTVCESYKIRAEKVDA